MPPEQSSSAPQVKTLVASQVSLHVYSHVRLALQAHSPGHLIGAFKFGQSQVAWQGPPSVGPPPHAIRASTNSRLMRSPYT